MAILTEDIKLLKSDIFADVPEGGGAMTGVTLVDGESNNLFPDTSSVDRALGRVNFRKVFGVAHTDDTDTLLGSHVMLAEGPSDPLVHCSLIKATGWADLRDAAKEAVEKYLVKGPKLSVRLYDQHYSGSLQIRLITFVGAPFPAGGDAIVLRTSTGVEQYVRILNVVVSTQNVAVTEGGSTQVLPASVATCELGQALAFDFLGPPAARVIGNEASFASIYSTTVSGGAKFYGIKPLATAASPGDFGVTSAGGIYTPVVPAATVETPIIDQYPLIDRAALTNTANSSVSLGNIGADVSAGSTFTLTFPTAIKPGSVLLTWNGSDVHRDDSLGNLLRGTTVIGSVDYQLKNISYLPGVLLAGLSIYQATYTPATSVGASNHSAQFLITIANQGLSFTNAFEPPPAPGSFKLSFMAQGRWYSLTDNLVGKLSGADSTHGVGTINYVTGSMSVTLGAVPDIGSPLIAEWGDSNSAVAVPSAALPARLSAVLTLDPKTKVSGITVTWTAAGASRTATTDASGVLSGFATGKFVDGTLLFEPAYFPVDGTVTVTSKTAAASLSAISGTGPTYTLTGTLPVIPGTFRASVLVNFTADAEYPVQTLPLWDANGVVYANYVGSSLAVGTINYATGAIVMQTSASCVMYVKETKIITGGWARTYTAAYPQSRAITLLSPITGVGYASGVETDTSQVFTPSSYVARVATNGAGLLSSGAVFSLGNDNYSSESGSLRRGWNPSNGTASQVNAGSIGSAGSIAVNANALPANLANSVTFQNLAQDNAPGLVSSGVFRTASAPLKTGVFQMQVDALVASANDPGVISGGGFSGTVDYIRGVVRWTQSAAINPASLSYNAVFLQYLPLDPALLGLDTARLPLDGKVPIYRSGDLVVVHNTLVTTLPNPLVKNTVYSLGRERIASVRVKDALGVVVPSSLYISGLNPGNISVPTASNITGYAQPLKVEHRIEDLMLCSQVDISGALRFTSTLTHAFPATTSFISSALPFGDLFARPYNYKEQSTWTGVWTDNYVGSVPLANFNESLYPIVVSNRGAITERWAIIFTSTTGFKIVGEFVGEISSGNTSTNAAPVNPATGAPYFTLPALGWGNGWATGNVLRFNTAACGAPFWTIRTVLQGPATVDRDVFSIAFRGDVDRT